MQPHVQRAAVLPQRQKDAESIAEKAARRTNLLLADQAPVGQKDRRKRLAEEEGKQLASLSARKKAKISSVGENYQRKRFLAFDARVLVYFDRTLEGEDAESIKQVGGDCAASFSKACWDGATHVLVETLAGDLKEGRPSLQGLLARAMGLTLVEQHWLDLSVSSGRFVEAPTLYRAALEIQIQWYIHPSFEIEEPKLTDFLKLVILHVPCRKSRWLLKTRNAELHSDEICRVLVAAKDKESTANAAKAAKKTVNDAEGKYRKLHMVGQQHVGKHGHLPEQLGKEIEAALNALQGVKQRAATAPMMGKIWDASDFLRFLDTPV